MSALKDITGRRFGRLVVIEKAQKPEYTTYHSTLWRCLCDCGRESIVAGNSLRAGLTRSCGCLRVERMRDIHRIARERLEETK